MNDHHYLVVCKRDDQPAEVYPFELMSEAICFYEMAQAQWTCVYLCAVLESVGEVVRTRPATNPGPG